MIITKSVVPKLKLRRIVEWVDLDSWLTTWRSVTRPSPPRSTNQRRAGSACTRCHSRRPITVFAESTDVRDKWVSGRGEAADGSRHSPQPVTPLSDWAGRCYVVRRTFHLATTHSLTVHTGVQLNWRISLWNLDIVSTLFLLYFLLTKVSTTTIQYLLSRWNFVYAIFN